MKFLRQLSFILVGLAALCTLARADTHSSPLHWLAPTENTDGSPLTNLAGYRVYRGTDAQNLSLIVTIPDPAVLGYTDTPAAPGTYFYAVSAFTPLAESVLSATVTHTIRMGAPSGGVVLPAPHGGVVLPN